MSEEPCPPTAVNRILAFVRSHRTILCNLSGRSVVDLLQISVVDIWDLPGPRSGTEQFTAHKTGLVAGKRALRLSVWPGRTARPAAVRPMAKKIGTWPTFLASRAFASYTRVVPRVHIIPYPGRACLDVSAASPAPSGMTRRLFLDRLARHHVARMCEGDDVRQARARRRGSERAIKRGSNGAPSRMSLIHAR